MVNNKYFIQIPTHESGLKYVNITSIALIEEIGSRTIVTLKDKNTKGDNIIFEASLAYAALTAKIHELMSKS